MDLSQVWCLFVCRFHVFLKLGHFLKQLAAGLLEWSPHQKQEVGRQGGQEHLQTSCHQMLHTMKQQRKKLYFCQHFSWFHGLVQGRQAILERSRAAMTKELIREVWSSQYLPGSCQTNSCCRDVRRAIQRRPEGEAGCEISALLMLYSEEASPWGAVC